MEHGLDETAGEINSEPTSDSAEAAASTVRATAAIRACAGTVSDAHVVGLNQRIGVNVNDVSLDVQTARFQLAAAFDV